tara:strand:- start:912 stop:1328 length:417 start_codon:yes stop_codon:yes gene_type:complete
MSRIIALDFGLKRIGIAITDDSNKLAFGIETSNYSDIIKTLRKITKQNQIRTIVVGKPVKMNNIPSLIERNIQNFIKKLKKEFSSIDIERYDERFTSIIAKKAIRTSSLNKNKKRDKKLVDKVSATLILQSYLQKISL